MAPPEYRAPFGLEDYPGQDTEEGLELRPPAAGVVRCDRLLFLARRQHEAEPMTLNVTTEAEGELTAVDVRRRAASVCALLPFPRTAVGGVAIEERNEVSARRLCARREPI